jgi:hypothetical protein
MTKRIYTCICLAVLACGFCCQAGPVFRLRFEYPYLSQGTVETYVGSAASKGGFSAGAILGTSGIGFGIGFSPSWGTIKGTADDSYVRDVFTYAITREINFSYAFSSIELLCVAELFSFKDQSFTATLGTGYCFGDLSQEMHFIVNQDSTATGSADKSIKSSTGSGFPFFFGIGYTYKHVEIFTNARFYFVGYDFSPYDYTVFMGSAGSFTAHADDSSERLKLVQFTLGVSMLFGNLEKKKIRETEIKE